ncbi:MAG: cbb3-type cytochrome c oxidase subunit I [Parachlamydia sp.]|jgi:cytochrome c oxidase cbb3-type subunit 1|nr:cbb3-type cytochrome c oxidase subunit I [Parachlamydia sp.]
MTYDDRAAKLFLYPSVVFMLIGMIIGVFISFNGFVFPDYFAGEYISFGRVRPVHVGTVTLLWLLSVDVGLMLYFVPRLCGVSIWSPSLALWGGALWWFSLTIGVNSYPWGTNFGWEYAELPTWVSWIPVKVLFTVGWLMLVYNFFMTIANRRYEKLYVSLWYSMGTLIWTTFVVFVGSFAINWVPEGLSRVNVSWFYVHNLVGLIYTPMGLAAAYYFLPKLANTPIYSHRLSMIGFWSVAFIYAWIGTHHIIHGPISQWLQTVSIVFSIWMFIPVWTVVYNLFATLQHDWQKYFRSAPIRFLMMGNVFYLITCAQGSLQSLRNVNEITSKTDWIIGHSHIALYGTFTFFAIAGLYQAIPTMVKKPLWSDKLADWHFALNLWGSLVFLFSLWLGGFLQGLAWANWADGSSYAEFHENLIRLPFLQTVSDMKDWWILRGLGGIVILFGNVLFAINLFNTVVLSTDVEKEPPEPAGVLT